MNTKKYKNIQKFFILFYFFVLIIFEDYLLLFKNILHRLLKIIDISIIIPIYNREACLHFCLNSVINQSLKNIEIICIDDGSEDNSLKILKKYKKRDNRLIIIHQNNQGPAKARNIGIKISKGKFISFMDSDDLFPNNYTLELMFKKAILNKVLICGGGLRAFIQYNDKIKILNKLNISFSKNAILYYSKYQFDFYYQRFIYNKNFIKKNKLYFPNYLGYEDPPFFINVMGLAKKFYALKNITYYYNVKTPNKIKLLKERNIVDIYKGLRDSLYYSKSMHLYKLYYLVLLRFNSNYFINDAKKFINSKKLKAIISQIIHNIDYNLLIKNNYKFIKKKFYDQFN